MSVADKLLKCRDCGTEFTWTAGEQEFFIQKGLLNEPQRCPSCRVVKRQQRYGPRPISRVTCAACGAETLVPFHPREDRPVFCGPCYAQARVRSPRLA